MSPARTSGGTVCACGRPVHDAHLCRACTRSLQRALATAALIDPDLDIAIARLAVFGPRAGSGPAKGKTRPLLFDQRASDAAFALRDTLAAWIRALNRPGVTDPRTAAMAWWLLRSIDRVRQHPDAGTALAGITHAVRRAQQAIDRPPGRVYAGPCQQCGLDVLARPGSTSAACRGCGQVCDVAARQAAMRDQLADHLGSVSYAAVIVTALGCRVSDSTVRTWTRRGKLTPRPGGLYRIGDVLDLALARDTIRAAG